MWKKIIGILVCILLICTILPVSANVIFDRIYADDLSLKDVLVSFNIYGKSNIENRQVMLSSDEATFINDLFEKLQYAIIHNPFTDETKYLKSSFIGLLDEEGLLPDGISNDEVIELLNPSLINQLKQNKLMISFLSSLKISSIKGSAFFCSVASGGNGKTTPIVIGPRPHAIVRWRGVEGQELTATFVGGLNSEKGFIAYGNQNGMLIGFEGIGITYGTPYGTIYGLTGYAVYASVTADYIEFYPPNNKPEISNPNPSNNQENIPTTLSELSFQIQDDDKELMNYSVNTNPLIGSGSKNKVGNGIYKISIDGLQLSTTYTWTVTVTDGKDTTTNIFSFTTIMERPIVINPIPIDGSSTNIDLSELSFTLTDAQGDKMDYTVQTSPNIGSSSATGVGDGTYSIQISKLKENIWYYWYVNVTDGVHLTKERFSFYTGGLGLVGYWSFDEGIDNIAYDTSAYRNDATLFGPTWTSDSISGYALEFDGINDYTLADDNPSLNFHDTNEFTISFWFKSTGSLTSYSSECLISKGTTAYNAGYSIGIISSNKTIYFEIFNEQTYKTLYSKTAIKEDTWYNIVTVWDGTQQYIYLNGLLDIVKYIGDFTISDDPKPLEFGHHYGYTDGKAAFHGIIDEIHIYDRVFNENEKMNLYLNKLI